MKIHSIFNDMQRLNIRRLSKPAIICISLLLIGSILPIFAFQGVQAASSVTAKSGSAADLQAAINSLGSAGGTVYIPAGTYQWNGQTVTVPGGVNVIGASPAGDNGHEYNWATNTATTILHENSPGYGMFSLDGSNGKASRISGIQFEASPPANPTVENNMANNLGTGIGIDIEYMKDFRIDHCTFINWVNIAVMANTHDTPHQQEEL